MAYRFAINVRGRPDGAPSAGYKRIFGSFEGLLAVRQLAINEYWRPVGGLLTDISDLLAVICSASVGFQRVVSYRWATKIVSTYWRRVNWMLTDTRDPIAAMSGQSTGY